MVGLYKHLTQYHVLCIIHFIITIYISSHIQKLHINTNLVNIGITSNYHYNTINITSKVLKSYGLYTLLMLPIQSIPCAEKILYKYKLFPQEYHISISQRISVKHLSNEIQWFCNVQIVAWCRMDNPLSITITPLLAVSRYWPFMLGIHWLPVNSPHKGPVTRICYVSLSA